MKIVKFEKNNCAPCVRVSNFLNDLEVEFTALNPFNGGEAAELAAKYDIGFQLPVVVLTDDEGNKLEMSRGYNEEELTSFAAKVKA